MVEDQYFNPHCCAIEKLQKCGSVTAHLHTSIKNIKKMLKDVRMAVPKTTATRCRDGSVQARHVIQRLRK